jgi:hypothetical protein
MSTHLRDDNECQNCGRTVDEVYCPRCGQKNTETRQPFLHLVAHFAEDLTHYDGAFWKTMKFLLFRPAYLTQQYLQGKRQAYVPPVKLYIFISFITFLLPSILPDFSPEEENFSYTENILTPTENTIDPTRKENVWITDYNTDGIPNPMSYRTIKEMDSIEATKPKHLRLNEFEYKVAKKMIHRYRHKTPLEVLNDANSLVISNIPKALFIYLPIFAFWIWLFHGKKRWYFFDHSIYTLHYFSFMLLLVSIGMVLRTIIQAIDYDLGEDIYYFLLITFPIWAIYYFYLSHWKMYREKWHVNIIKCTVMLAINIFCVAAISLILFYIAFYNLG